MRNIVLVVGLLLAFSLIGCGGAGGHSGSSTPSPFGGSWNGVFTEISSGQTGVLAATVDTNGNLTGSLVNNTIGSTASVTGKVTNAGDVNATITYPASAGGTVTSEIGTVSISTTTGNLEGIVNEFQHGTQVGNATFNLVKQ